MARDDESVPAQPVIQRRLGPARHHGTKPRHDPGRQGLLGAGQRPALADLRQHRGQATYPRVHRIAVGTRPGRRSIAGYHLRQPRTFIASDLAQNPRPGRLTQLPVGLIH